MDLCHVQPEDRILDVGAGAGAALERFNSTNEIVAVDLEPLRERVDDESQRHGSGRRRDTTAIRGRRVPRRVLELGDRAHSEGAPGRLSRARSAGSAERYYVQTPNRYFPIEPHYQLPFFQFLPERLRRALNKRFTLGWKEKGKWEEINLLTARDLRRLFPDGEIHRERLFGLTKSLMVIRRG